MRTHLIILITIAVVGCGKKLPTTTGPVDGPVSYAATIQPIFNTRCVSCHSASVPQNGVALHSYLAVVNSNGSLYSGPIIIAGNPANSPLVDKIEANPRFGSRMPQGSSLSSAQIAAIRQWVQEGALNN